MNSMAPISSWRVAQKVKKELIMMGQIHLQKKWEIMPHMYENKEAAKTRA